MWSHVRLINSQNKNAEISVSDIVFPLDINDYERTERRFQMQDFKIL